MAAKIGDKAVVLADLMTNPSIGTTIESITLVQSAELPITVGAEDYFTTSFAGDSLYMADVMITQTSCEIYIEGSDCYGNASYTSTDGKIYTFASASFRNYTTNARVNTYGQQFDLGIKVTLTGSEYGTLFIQSKVLDFGGIFNLQNALDDRLLLDYAGNEHRVDHLNFNNNGANILTNSLMSSTNTYAWAYTPAVNQYRVVPYVSNYYLDESTGDVYLLFKSSSEATRYLDLYDSNLGTFISETSVTKSASGFKFCNINTDIFVINNGYRYPNRAYTSGQTSVSGSYVSRAAIGTYKDQWLPQDIGIDTDPSQVAAGAKYFSNRGVLTGTLGTPSDNPYYDLANPLYMNILNNMIKQSSAIVGDSMWLQGNSTSGLFNGCKDCEAIPITTFMDTSNITTFSCMFDGLSKVTHLDLSNFNTSKGVRFQSMFRGMSSLQELDLSSFDFSGMTDNSWMFDGCTSLMKLDIRTWDLVNNVNYGYGYKDMFRGVPTDCLFIVKDETQKAQFTTKFSSWTNVKTVAEYTAN